MNASEEKIWLAYYECLSNFYRLGGGIDTLLCYKPKEQFIELIQFMSERRIMKENEIESLIASTIERIKCSLNNNQPENTKIYAEALVLLRQTINVPQESRFDKLFAEFHRNESLKNSVDINKPFKQISDKHIPDV